MRLLPLLLCLVWLPHAMAEDSIRTVTEYVKQSPAYVWGQIAFEEDHRVFHHEVLGRSVFGAYIRAHEPIEVMLTESDITITSKNGLRISMAGLPVRITRLHFDNRTGRASATSSVLGTRMESSWIESRAEKAVEREFGPKLRTAFAHLGTLRAQNSLEDVGQVLNDVVNSFKSEHKDGKPGHPLPTFEGHLTLVFPVAKAETIQIGRATADLQDGDRIQTTVMIRVPSRKKLQIRGILFSSNLGIKLKKLELFGITVTEESGVRLTAQNGVDGTIASAAFLLSGRLDSQSHLAQDLIDQKFAAHVGDFARAHEDRLLKVGLTPALLRSLESSSDL